MRVLYGVVGEGMGHAIRSRVILDELVKKHDVQVVVSGRAHDYLAKRAGGDGSAGDGTTPKAESSSGHLSVKKIWGFTIVTADNEVRNLRTLPETEPGAAPGGRPLHIQAHFASADAIK